MTLPPWFCQVFDLVSHCILAAYTLQTLLVMIMMMMLMMTLMMIDDEDDADDDVDDDDGDNDDDDDAFTYVAQFICEHSNALYTTTPESFTRLLVGANSTK